MHTLTAGEVLAVWQRGADRHTIDRCLDVLACALPDCDPGELARLPLGRRDMLLLAVRRATLGETLDTQDVCPACGERVEVQLGCSELAAAGETPPTEWSLEHEAYRLTLRALDSIDAAAAAQCDDVETARRELLSRSIVAAQCDGEAVGVESLTEEAASAVAACIAAHDTGAEILLDFTCPSCKQSWRNVLDVASFVWTELSARARRLIVDVHTLASAYGWREADILRLSDARRAAYLALVTA